MQKTRYSEQPEPVLVEAIKGYVHITVAVNITQVESDPPAWEADTNRFWVPAGELDLDAVRQNPAAYLHRATHLSDARAEAKAKAQMAVDSLRNGCPVVLVPSFRAGAAVCHRPADDVKMLGGFLMGGLPYFELASGEVVSLTADDLAGIMQDVTQWEVAVQQAKQAAWVAIDAATSQDEIDAALIALEAALS